MKKLFSYLLISSMVVLSSCTNYDDQFDDLNSQINSLKSQIEGFSSLSSGLTALQGTVSSLQSAVAALPKTATPATDISGLEASVASLQTQLASASTSAEVTALTTQLTAAQAALADAIAANATAAEANASSIAGNATAIENLLAELETLATSLAGIKADLAAADTSADVAALTTALAAAQADLTTLLAQNNVYTGTLKINSASTLAAAEQLGDKISIINGSVDIDQTSTDIDADKLQAVVSKITTITDNLNYDQTGTGVTAVNFDGLTGVTDITITQKAPISLPSLVSASAVVFTKDIKVTSVSAPALKTVKTLSDGSGIGMLDFSAGGTSVDLGALVETTGDDNLTVKVKTTGTIDLEALSPTNSTTGKSKDFDLTTVGAKNISLPNYVQGDFETDAEVVTLVKFKDAPTFTGTANLEELHMHAVEADLSTKLAGQTNISILDIIGVVPTVGDVSVTKADSPVDITITNASKLETLTLAGSLGEVSISSASSLSSVSTSGSMVSFELDGATDLTTLTLGHGPSAASTYKRSDLIINGATSLTSLTADKINNANTLKLTGNTDLATVSFAALKAVATAKTAMEPRVTITGNAFAAQNVQLPSPKDIVPVVAGKVTTNSGFTAMKTYFDAAIAAKGDVITVHFDTVDKITDHLGEEYTADTATTSKKTGITATTNDATIDAAATSAAWVFIQTDKGTAGTSDTPTDYEVQTAFIALETEGGNLTYKGLAATESVNVKVAGITTQFGADDADGGYTTIAAVKDAINAFDFGTDVTVTAALDAGHKSYNKIIYNNLATGAATDVVGGGSLTWQLGDSDTASGTIVTATGSTVAQIQTTLIAAINTAGFGGSEHSYNATAETIASVPYIVLTRETTGTSNSDLGTGITFPTLSFVVTDTAGYTQFGATMSNVAAEDYALSVDQKNIAGLRVTMRNNSLVTALTSNETVTITTASSGVMSDTTITTLVTGTVNMVPNKAISLPFSEATAYDDGSDAIPAKAIDATAWL